MNDADQRQEADQGSKAMTVDSGKARSCPADPQAANAIGHPALMKAPKIRGGAVAEPGRKRILEKFNWRKAAEETLAVYEEILPPKRRSFVAAQPDYELQTTN